MPPTRKARAIRAQDVTIFPYPTTNKFYTQGPTRRPGPKRILIVEKALTFPAPVKNPQRSYTALYKLRVISYWLYAEIPYGPSRTRKLTRVEVSFRFKIPETNISRWKHRENIIRCVLSTERRSVVTKGLRH